MKCSFEIERAADAMADWGGHLDKLKQAARSVSGGKPHCPACGQPTWDEDAGACETCGHDVPRRAPAECDCGAKKAGTTHALWCATRKR